MTRRLLDQDPQRERRRQIALLRILEQRSRSMVEREIARASREMIRSFELHGGDPQMPDDHLQRMADIFHRIALISITAFGNRVVEQGKSKRLILETKSFAEFFQRLAAEFVMAEAIRQRIVSITNTTRNHIIREISRGREAGLGVDAIARNLTDSAEGISRQRAALIARTETHAAANYGAHNAANATGLNMDKEWISVQDHRTRDFGEGDGEIDEFNHRAANGQVVKHDQPFLITHRSGVTEQLMFPGDPEGSAGNTINCRCALGWVLPD